MSFAKCRAKVGIKNEMQEFLAIFLAKSHQNRKNNAILNKNTAFFTTVFVFDNYPTPLLIWHFFHTTFV